MIGRSSLQSAEDFKLDEVVITFDGAATTLNITNIVAEINIYESLQSLYLTGSMTFVDDQDFVNEFNFRGTERVRITVSLPIPEFTPITKHFVIQNFEQPIKTNDYTTIYTANLIEDVGFLGSIEKFSRSYVGSGEQIIGNIVKNILKKNVYNWNEQTQQFGNSPPTFIASDQSRFQYIVPNITPIEAISIIRNKMTTANGLPYFVHSSIVSDDIIIRDLETILSTTPFNVGQPYVFSQSMTNSGADNPLAHAFSINQMEGQMLDDTMLLAQLGGVGAYYHFRNITTGQISSGRFNSYNVLKNLVDIGVIPDTEPDLLIADNFFPENLTSNVIGSKKLQDYNSKFFRDVAGATHIDNIKNFTEEANMSSYMKRVISHILHQHLLKNVYTINIPGYMLLSSEINRSVGNTVELRVFKTSIPTNKYELAQSIDVNRSGKFIMLQKRHVFNCTSFKHNVTVMCGRLSKQKSI